ncbi:YcaO-like family protein [Mesorhizobium sp. RMAD-H1]|uniref:YcaO-like family protein n=1 Tax=Mesorhizobium sp. RMAD-H1 TaxID=2587065 RepID=UPI00161035A5|nr:YcaO-like family protein [Mesorhizobium sp. RMAD-H1]MBB2971806.1 ribosomal protein S12 methylthiotransferase accessory factor [Mesorhizobium sp. RMAD-H1]
MMAETAPSGDTQQCYSDRIRSPEATFEAIRPHLSPLGVTRLARVTGLDRIGIPVWNAVVPNSRSIVINQGKGIRDIDARVSAAMEALERAIACAPEIDTVTSTRGKLIAAGAKAEPLICLTAAGHQDLGDGDETAWAQGRDLFSGDEVWVPLDAALLDRTVENCRYWQSSDGLASGNTLDEAIFHGLLERIERDAETLWKVTSPAGRLSCCIDPRSFADPVVDDLCGRIEDAGFVIRLFDITSDIAIPCFVAIIGPRMAGKATQCRFVDVAQGNGAHPHPVRAAIRAITEAAQSRLTFISGARDDIFPETFLRPLPEDTRQLLEAHPGPADIGRGTEKRGLAPLTSHVLEKLESARITSAIALPLTHGEYPFAVCKVFVPGLENPEGKRRRRFGPRAISRSLAFR